MKTLILFYSFGGNTKKIAKMINKEIPSVMCEVETVKPYEGDYDTVVEYAKKEVEMDGKPDIKKLLVNPSDYDVIFLGSPVWWYTFAPAINTVLNSFDFKGKTVYPFITNGGWLGTTMKDIKNKCKDSVVKDGINIVFDEEKLRTKQAEINNWINKAKKELNL